MDLTADDLRNIGLVLAALFACGVVIFALLLAYAIWVMRHLDIPSDAGFADTLHVTPLLVVIGIDLLDLTLDVLAAPATWLILDRMGLKALRNIATIEAIIPGTQVIPTLTLAWIIVRVFNITSDRSKMIEY
ncbi:MAG: hypothetical protein WAM60_01090 [Candidatus Promineifilaceae bacterium]